jgi:hypothetical protein
MKVKLLTPIKGYGYFEGEVVNLPDKEAKKAIEEKKAEPAGKTEEK